MDVFYFFSLFNGSTTKKDNYNRNIIMLLCILLRSKRTGRNRCVKYRPVNPVTGSNWEGTGVIPDVAIPEKAAQEYGKVKDKKIMEAADVIQRQLDQAEMFFKKGKKMKLKLCWTLRFKKQLKQTYLTNFLSRYWHIIIHRYKLREWQLLY